MITAVILAGLLNVTNKIYHRAHRVHREEIQKKSLCVLCGLCGRFCLKVYEYTFFNYLIMN